MWNWTDQGASPFRIDAIYGRASQLRSCSLHHQLLFRSHPTLDVQQPLQPAHPHALVDDHILDTVETAPPAPPREERNNITVKVPQALRRLQSYNKPGQKDIAQWREGEEGGRWLLTNLVPCFIIVGSLDHPTKYLWIIYSRVTSPGISIVPKAGGKKRSDLPKHVILDNDSCNNVHVIIHIK